ncbi:MAG: hypothetical protein A2474_00795 [Elusimicrobia bacterium RIFOXYC2_FULL_34_12]|nr:MAG: hypothetical protein A2474_00795 [Elusimicrobia bacterium RIFOXYC2_FULL_34_12]
MERKKYMEKKYLPSVLTNYPIFGLGYRSYWKLGNIVQAEVSKEYSLNVMLAQQSAREIERTKRSFKEVIESASESAQKVGLTRPWGSDGDHLRNEKEVTIAAESGCTHFTYDLSDALNKNKKDLIDKIKLFYDLTCQLRGKENFTSEISLDETESITDLKYVSDLMDELKNKKIEITEIAPHFPGYFEKAIDYYYKTENNKRIKDLKDFTNYLEEITKLSRRYGFKISVHSGSDKFSIYPIIAKVLKKDFHLKTAGTWYLEELKIVAKYDLDLFNEIYKVSYENYNMAKATYHITCNTGNIPDIHNTDSQTMVSLLESNAGNDDLRQLLHVTYGTILTSPDLSKRMESVLKVNITDYNKVLKAHIVRHVTDFL